MTVPTDTDTGRAAPDVLARLGALLGPSAPTGAVRSDTHAYVALPTPASVKLLVPRWMPKVAAGSIRSSSPGDRRATRLRRGIAAAGARVGAVGALPTRGLAVATGPGSLWRELHDRFAWFHAVGIHLGTPRPNRKPILLLADETGTTRAFAKVGWDPATSSLVRTEVEALTVGCPDAPVVMPALLDAFAWRDTSVAVQAPVTIGVTGRDSLTAPLLAEVTRAIAAPQPETHRFGASQYADQLLRRIDAADLTTAQRSHLCQVVRRHADTPARFGRWHGDLTPWNSSSVGGEVTVWDWERWASSVPFGFDTVHYHLRLRELVADPTAERRRVVRAAAPALDLLQLPPRGAPLVHDLHAIELALRFSAHGSTAALVAALCASAAATTEAGS